VIAAEARASAVIEVSVVRAAIIEAGTWRAARTTEKVETVRVTRVVASVARAGAVEAVETAVAVGGKG
jgi:hypothetical protein